MQITWKHLVIISASAILGILIGVSTLSTVEYYRLATRGIRAAAKATEKDSANHRFVYYEYVVDGKNYVGVGNGGRDNPDFDNISVGQALIAYYDPDDPSRSCLGSAEIHFRTSLAGVFFISIALPVVVILSLRRTDWLKASVPQNKAARNL